MKPNTAQQLVIAKKIADRHGITLLRACEIVSDTLALVEAEQYRMAKDPGDYPVRGKTLEYL